MRKRVVIFVAFLAAAGFVAWLNQGLWANYLDLRQSERAERQRLEAAENEYVKALESSVKAGSAVGREEIARERGYLRNGEVPLEVSLSGERESSR
ncbi:MAG: hypothetical protein KatS3mg015_0562 [Fimbriimonadales bacterium]|nr:MAG: hypothetical protein KatS3mg015_0562 [Fimbriimonadales bacterium]